MPLALARPQEGVVDLLRIVATTAQRPDLIVGPVFDQRCCFRVFPEEMLSDIRAVFGFECLVVAIDGFIHQLTQLAGCIPLKQFVPAAAPKKLDDIPTRTTEVALKFLHDFAVAAYRAVKALQIAVHDKDQVIQTLAVGQINGAPAFGFVHLAIA